MQISPLKTTVDLFEKLENNKAMRNLCWVLKH